MNRREFVKLMGIGAGAAATGSLGLLLGGCGGFKRRRPVGRVFVLGFDGVDPDLVRDYMAAGGLPNIAELARTGALSDLDTTNPAQTPVAWSSFATGMNPGKTRIFDFLSRDPETYYPYLSTVDRIKPGIAMNLIPYRKPRISNLRAGKSLWRIAGENGIKTTVVQVPVTFPPEPIPGGTMIAGLETPDIRGTMGTFSYYATDLAAGGDTEMGGKLIPVFIEGDRVRTFVFGPRNPATHGGEVLVPLDLVIDSSESITIATGGGKQTVRVGRWSDWFEFAFELTPAMPRIHGMARFHLLELGKNHLRLYMSPINIHPARPAFPVTNPARVSEQLVDAIGLYKTLGWAVDTWALSEERIGEEVFMQDLFYTMNQREQIMDHLLDNDDMDLYIQVYSGTDRILHTYMRFIDERHPRHPADDDPYPAARGREDIRAVFDRMDRIVGKVMKRMQPSDTLLVMSDHGFNSWRRSVNINTWLADNGFMHAADRDHKDLTLEDLFGEGLLWRNVDWNRTRLYSLGLGQVWVNLRGRERHGIVAQGREYESLRDEFIEKYSALRDPETGEPVVRRVYRREEIYSGPFLDQAPDMVIGFNEGYRVSWQTCLGGLPPEWVHPNNSKWCGDHCSVDPEITRGFLLSSRRLGEGRPHIMDLAPTVLKLLGIDAPPDMDGRSLV